MDEQLNAMHLDQLAAVCRRTIARCEARKVAEDVFRRHRVEFVEVEGELTNEPETVRSLGPLDLDNQCGDGPFREPRTMAEYLATAEVMGVLRLARQKALTGAIPAAEVAILCLERLRDVGRRHDVPGCSDAEIDEAIAKFRAIQPAN